jgi:hypothetical protein
VPFLEDVDAVPSVRRRIADLLARERAVALVCSAACGADLLALEEAERLGLRRRIILPFSLDRFRPTSVIDRPGDWGSTFDRLVAAAEKVGDLVVLSGNDGGDDVAYAAANKAIISEAQKLAQGDTRHRLIAAIAWEGSARLGGDMTSQFRNLAAKAGFEDRVILTRSVAEEARTYLGGQELSPEQVKDLVKRLEHEDKRENASSAGRAQACLCN